MGIIKLERLFTSIVAVPSVIPLSTKSGLVLDVRFEWSGKAVNLNGDLVDTSIAAVFGDNTGVNPGVLGENETVLDPIIIPPFGSFIMFNPFATQATDMQNVMRKLRIDSSDKPYGVFLGKLDISLFMEPGSLSAFSHDLEATITILEFDL